MPKTDPGPLARTSKEIDSLKRPIDALLKESNKTVSNKKLKTDERLNALYRNCFDRKSELKKIRSDVENLKEADEIEKIKNYESKKTAELKRVDTLITQITAQMVKLFPERNEEEYTNEVQQEIAYLKKKQAREAAGNNGEESEEEESEDDEEEEEADTAVDGEKGEETKQASIRVKETEDDEEEDEDEEDESEEEEEEAEVNKTASSAAKPQKHVKVQEENEENEDDYEDEEEEEEEDEEEEDEEEDDDDEEEEDDNEEEKGKKGKEEDIQKETAPTLWTTVDDHNGDEEGDLSFKKGDIITVLHMRANGWWLAKNVKGEEGVVPKTFLQIYNKQVQQDEEDDEEEDEHDEGLDTARSSGKKHWGSIKKAITETTVSDVLHAMGAVPSGFRTSTLAHKHAADKKYSMTNYLTVKLSPSNLIYRDLFFDPATNKIRPRTTRIERVVTILSCQQIPLPSAGVEVLDRTVRVCLFDGTTILSNIHCISVSTTDKAQRSWSFTTKVTDNMELSPHAEFFVRTNNTIDNIGILFELCITMKRTSTQEQVEMSCGWVHLHLLDENGSAIHNRSIDLYVNGGTPYEKGVEVDPRISRRTSSNALVSLMSGNKQPRLVVRVAVPRKEHKDSMDLLPDPLVGNTVLLPFYSFYRQILADCLLRDRLDLDSTEVIHNPFLSLFPTVAEQMDMMKLMRAGWQENLRGVGRVEKRDEEFMKEQLKKTFMETVYPLHHVASLPAYKPADFENQQLRVSEVNKFCEMKLQRKTALAFFLSNDIAFQPFDMNEVTYSIIGPYCLSKQSHHQGKEQ